MPLAKTGRKSCAAPWAGCPRTFRARQSYTALRGHRHGTDEAAVFGVRRVAGDAARQEAQRALQGTESRACWNPARRRGRRPRNRRHGTVCAHDCKPLQDRERRKRRAGFGMPPGLRRGRARPALSALSAARFNRSPFRQARLAGLGGGRFGASQSPVREALGGFRRNPGNVARQPVARGAGRCPFFFLAEIHGVGRASAGLNLRLPGGS